MFFCSRFKGVTEEHFFWDKCKPAHVSIAMNEPSSDLDGNLTPSFLALRVNVSLGPSEERILITGLHTVADIYCNRCKTVVGWKYVSPLSFTTEFSLRNVLYYCLVLKLYRGKAASELCLLWKEEASEESQKYKEGKFVVEKAMISKGEHWKH